MEDWKKLIEILKREIPDKLTPESVDESRLFGEYLAKKEEGYKELTTSQLRKFFGEVKRQQMRQKQSGFNEIEFAMLKPKLAYAVGRAHQNRVKSKIDDFYKVLSIAIDAVISSNDREKAFNNFINIFEAIVAYHKSAEK